MKLIIPIDPEVASFSDDTSPDARLLGRRDVSIYAQVVNEPSVSMDWFYELRSQYPDIPGEIKGSQIVQDFERFPDNVRRKVLLGLRKVRTHVSDPGPYEEELRHAVARVAGGDGPSQQELHYQARRGDLRARYWLGLGEEYVSKRLLQNTPYDRLLWRLHSGWPMPSNGLEESLLWIDQSLPALRTRRKSLVARASELAAKMAPAFGHAEEEAHRRFVGSLPLFRYMSRDQFASALGEALRLEHKYDRGDEKLHGMLNMKWTGLATLADEIAFPSELWRPDVRSVGTFDSADSVFGQASDVAGRFAATFYEREGLMGLVRRFDYVNFNGNRVGEAEAAELLRRNPILRH